MLRRKLLVDQTKVHSAFGPLMGLSSMLAICAIRRATRLRCFQAIQRTPDKTGNVKT